MDANRVLRPRQNRTVNCEPHKMAVPGPRTKTAKSTNRVEPVPKKTPVQKPEPATNTDLQIVQGGFLVKQWMAGRYYSLIIHDLFVILKSLQPIRIENIGSIVTNLAFDGKRFYRSFNRKKTVNFFQIA